MGPGHPQSHSVGVARLLKCLQLQKEGRLKGERGEGEEMKDERGGRGGAGGEGDLEAQELLRAARRTEAIGVECISGGVNPARDLISVLQKSRCHSNPKPVVCNTMSLCENHARFNIISYQCPK